MSPNSIAAQNNKAIELLRRGLANQALYQLESGLRTITAANQFACNDNEVPLLNIETLSESLIGEQNYCLENEGMFCLFDKALPIRENSELSLSNAHRIAAILLFNMGLSLHVKGIQGESRNGNLSAALNSYMGAVKLVQGFATMQEGIPSSSSFLTSTDIFICLAAVNNMACIHSHFFDQEQTQYCLITLKSMLNMCDENPVIKNYIALSNARHFYLPIWLYEGREIYHAAPAA